ncbi:MAG TPA: CBS domain-containing protein [Thermoplasmata archaeon]|nr:CBS domain-containing protein [Thermoplasmata archaeon]
MPGDRPTARDLMTPKPITLSTDAPLSRALGVMRTKGIHELPVLLNNRLVGLITFETIARRTNLPLSTKVEHLLVLPPLVTPTTTYSELAEQLLATGLRAAPVVGKKGELVGIVSRTDLVRAFSGMKDLSAHLVEQVASPPGLLIHESESCGTLLHQIRLLEEHPLPVIDAKGRLVGAVGVADLGRVLWRPTVGGKRDAARPGNVLNVEVGSIMHSPALTVPPGTTTGEAAKLMTREKVSSVFLLERGRPTGVVSQSDLLGLAVGTPGGTDLAVEDVYVQIHGVRASGDPSMLTEIDRLIAKALKHIARNTKPVLLSVHITPHATHRAGDATVQARLHTDRGVFHASETGWNFFASIQQVLDDLVAQTRRDRDERRTLRKRAGRVPAEDDEPTVDGELEAKIRAAAGED